MWYAVLMPCSTDWGTGSHDLFEAVEMARKMNAPKVIEIDEYEGVITDELIRGKDY